MGLRTHRFTVLRLELHAWIDDGVYPVEITVEDEERDESVMILNVTVQNRDPKIEVRSQRTEAKVEYPITLYAYANDSDSEYGR